MRREGRPLKQCTRRQGPTEGFGEGTEKKYLGYLGSAQNHDRLLSTPGKVKEKRHG